jgi:hypothetical protein
LLTIELILSGFIAGIVATTGMTLVELVFWKKWKLIGVLEWHENQVLVSKFFKLDVKMLNFPGIFLLHFANGGFGGIGFFFALILMPHLSSIIPIIPLGIVYGFFLWMATLAPIHKPITGVHPLNHPLGKGPALVSLGGHALYGLVLGIIFTIVISA